MNQQEPQASPLRTQMRSQSDIWLIQTLQAQYTPPAVLRAAQYEVYRRIEQTIERRFARAKLQIAPVEIEDVTQFTATRLFSQVARVQGASISGWASTTASRRIASLLRRQSHARRDKSQDKQEVLTSRVAVGSDPTEPIEVEELDRGFERHVKELDAVHRAAIELWLAGQDPKAAAAQLGVSVRTYQRRSNRALKLVLHELGCKS